MGRVRQERGKVPMWRPIKVASCKQWGCIASSVGPPENHPEYLLELSTWKNRMLEQ